ncbi:hypothetical protein L596_026868 [Steinernema carpocapsae]|uniref:glucuronosyltransferase n=1 Tax=Steinernema carpocapsae TaxID=34508 RepID=A0A4U5M2M3_STECR|nr:hypothetical protein L596_026868 [Steinernema carpocapsae]
MLLLPFIFGCLSLSEAKKYKIMLFTPKFAHSHTSYMGKIADTLVEAGHDVLMSFVADTMARTAEARRNFREIAKRKTIVTSTTVLFDGIPRAIGVPYEPSYVPEGGEEDQEVQEQFQNVTFIWKYENEEDNIGKDVPNLVAKAWVPQNDLLSESL